MCETSKVRVNGMPATKIGTTHDHAQLGLPGKGRAFKGLVVWWWMLL